jgi:hypothetical protein
VTLHTVNERVEVEAVDEAATDMIAVGPGAVAFRVGAKKSNDVQDASPDVLADEIASDPEIVTSLVRREESRPAGQASVSRDSPAWGSVFPCRTDAPIAGPGDSDAEVRSPWSPRASSW